MSVKTVGLSSEKTITMYKAVCDSLMFQYKAFNIIKTFCEENCIILHFKPSCILESEGKEKPLRMTTWIVGYNEKEYVRIIFSLEFEIIEI